MIAMVRVVDYILGHGSYRLFERDGLFGEWTTEGMSNSNMFPVMKQMCSDNDYVSICLDYSAYDAQLTLKLYKEVLILLNTHRYQEDEVYRIMLDWMIRWLEQPKPIVVRRDDSYEVVLSVYRTLASGLHMTHSIENLIGVATAMKLKSLGYRVIMAKCNGDDQNLKVHRDDLEAVMR